MKKALIFLLLLISFTASAVEVAPRISDREIIESLAELKAELKAGQKVIHQRFEQVDQRFEQVDQRFEQVDQRFEQMQAAMTQRFEQVDQRFEQMQAAMTQRFEQVDQRFEQMQTAMNQRFEQSSQQFNNMHNTMLTLFATVGALIVTLFGYIIWDRRTALKPLEERFNALEKDLVYDLQLRDNSGSLLTRITQTLRKLAEDDPQVAGVLKSFSLM